MKKQKQSSFGSLVVTPCFLGVGCCPSVVVTLPLVSHGAKAKGLDSQIQAQGELLRNCFHTQRSRFFTMFSESLAATPSSPEEALEGVKRLLSRDH